MKRTLNKSQILLYIYDSLKRKGNISKDEIRERCLINDLTFRRYMHDLRDYLEKTSSSVAITYSSKDKRYYLVKRRF